MSYRAFWQRRCRAAAAGAVLKPLGGNCAVLPKVLLFLTRRQTKAANTKKEEPKMSKAVIFFAQGLEECEALLCVDILR
ncbi:MAG: hypothetical protein UC451_08775, partial [Faecalibacterium sp.]|nr:hypothetical protein [Faecalibacterium sp.]